MKVAVASVVVAILLALAASLPALAQQNSTITIIMTRVGWGLVKGLPAGL